MAATKRPLSLVQFSSPVNLPDYDFPQTQWVQKSGVTQAFLDYEKNEVTIGADVFPVQGGLVAHYRFAAAALAPKKATESPSLNI